MGAGNARIGAPDVSLGQPPSRASEAMAHGKRGSERTLGCVSDRARRATPASGAPDGGYR